MTRIKISHDGSIHVPAKLLRSIGLRPGSYAIIGTEDGRLWVEKTDYDPFTEGNRPPADDSIERILDQEREKSDQANRKFDRLIENPPEVRPEDRRDFWD